MKRVVHWDDEENGESEMEPFEEASEIDVSDDEHSNDEEPQIKDVLGNLSKTVSRESASEGKQTIGYAACIIWDKVPLNLKELNIHQFSKQLKPYLLSEQHN